MKRKIKILDILEVELIECGLDEILFDSSKCRKGRGVWSKYLRELLELEVGRGG